MSEENSEQQLEAIHKQAGEWFNDFIKSPHYETLCDARGPLAPHARVDSRSGFDS